MGGLDLSGMDEHLGSPEQIRAKMAECYAEIEAYQAKYGKDWIRHHMRDHGDIVDYDRDMKTINTLLWYGMPVASGENLRRRAEARMREIYGDRYDELKCHAREDETVAAMLVEDAVKTGKWKELPDELQCLYLDRAG